MVAIVMMSGMYDKEIGAYSGRGFEAQFSHFKPLYATDKVSVTCSILLKAL
jgi:hypothetical protein